MLFKAHVVYTNASRNRHMRPEVWEGTAPASKIRAERMFLCGAWTTKKLTYLPPFGTAPLLLHCSGGSAPK